jgi:hypothetical protein
MNNQQALSNIELLHRQVRLTPEAHEAIKESISVFKNRIDNTAATSNISIENAFNNLVAMYNASSLTLSEHEALKASFQALVALVQPVNEPVNEPEKVKKTIKQL